ncbi:MAG: 2-aminobenzoate-CoA ligase, partial [Betaproteobacteria bacterium]|nr:2-aminobenzoate-CoA ligase [Betaproteobacteria bacterium]
MQDWNVLAPSSHTDTFARDHLPPSDQWPVFQADLPVLTYPAILNCGAELVDRHVAQGRGGRIAIHGMAPGPNGPVQVAWTYAQLRDHCHQIAQVLIHDMGLVPGNRLLLRGANTPMMAACFLAALQAGLVVVPTMPMLRATELSTIIAKAQVSAALCDAALLEELQFCQVPGHPQYQPLLQQVLAFRSDAYDG